MCRRPIQRGEGIGGTDGGSYHHIRYLCERNGVQVFSSNYELYGDMSGRVVSVLRRFAPELEVYSIDESFLNFSGLSDPLGLAMQMRRTVGQWTGIPISVGLGPTKTLAKLANRLAKKSGSGCMQVKVGEEDILARVAIEDVWGVGRRLAVRLRRVGALDARGFINLPPSVVRSIGGVTLEQAPEGAAWYSLSEYGGGSRARKNTCCSRSFGKPLTGLWELEEAVANYAVRAIRRYAPKSSLACGIQVFVMTNRFREDQAQIFQCPGTRSR